MPQQISIFAENKPGKIEKITAVLEERDINIRAITITDSGDYGIIKMLVDRPVDAANALNENGITAALKDIVAVKIEDRPGGLHQASAILAKENINVEDAYGFTIHETSRAVFIFQVDNVTHTEKILEKAGFSILTDSELYLL